jgi:hypothetical protein
VEREILGGREIEIHQVRTIVLVPPRSADAPGWRGLGEVGCVKGRVGVGIVLSERTVANYIGTVVKLVESTIVL